MDAPPGRPGYHIRTGASNVSMEDIVNMAMDTAVNGPVNAKKIIRDACRNSHAVLSGCDKRSLGGAPEFVIAAEGFPHFVNLLPGCAAAEFRAKYARQLFRTLFADAPQSLCNVICVKPAKYTVDDVESLIADSGAVRRTTGDEFISLYDVIDLVIGRNDHVVAEKAFFAMRDSFLDVRAIKVQHSVFGSGPSEPVVSSDDLTVIFNRADEDVMREFLEDHKFYSAPLALCRDVIMADPPAAVPVPASQSPAAAFSRAIFGDEGKMITEMREDGYINATKMCKSAGKEFNDFKSLQSTKTLVARLQSKYPWIPGVFIITRGRNGGAWVCARISLDLARWCSPTFADAVADVVLRYSRGEITTEESQQVAATLVATVCPTRPALSGHSADAHPNIRVKRQHREEPA